MILRYHDGTIIFAAYRFMFHCNDALEAEIHVLMHGMSLAMQHTELSVVVQSDSSIALSIFRHDSLVCPSYGNLALETSPCEKIGCLFHKSLIILGIE